ncbi:MAG: 16S rRNA (uracil(1498)-N(3))-methyltransferase [Actinomycetia bacterium]|nr:16S rRNA (uracil(1498)-N(3))-methyltransferase [Actinomycetes bacterium]MCH9801861.1 16S rRNA (uracil(1498)-N(3))-methyltransferase [Actinomycetes bacterium]
MTPPVFLIPATDLAKVQAGDRFPVTGEEGRHGAAALRLRSGESVVLVDGDGRRVPATVADVTRDSFVVELATPHDEPPPALSITAVQALAKGDRADSAVEMMTEAGVDRIIPWSASRSIAVWKGERAERGLRRWNAVVRAASKQARRARFPQVAPLHNTDQLAELLGSAATALVLHESAEQPLSTVPLASIGELVLVVGPEGGISDDELDRFRTAGATPVRLGGSVLRTSTAGVVAAAVVMTRSGRWQ